MSTQIRNSEMSNILQPDMFSAGLWSEVIAGFQALPGLVGFWPMSSVQRSTGNVYDLSGQSRTLTYNGNPTFNYTGLVPYIDLDGTGDYLSRADETDLDILGTETIYNSAVRGLTVGGWFWSDNLTGNKGLISKDDGTTNLGSSFILSFDSGGVPTGRIYSGVSSYYKGHTTTISTGVWYFVVLRFIPSTSLDIILNGVVQSNTTSIPASINNSTISFLIGTSPSLGAVDGRASLCFLSANTLSNSIISGIYQRSRLLFNV